VEPVLVAVVEYASWTGDGRLRAPVFKGFSATPPDEVRWESEGPG
jgi:ATP-dependent DNA ligase